MYKLEHFTEDDEQKVIAFIKENSFAMLIGSGENYPVATQVPLEVEKKDGQLYLHGHIMRKTDHHKAFEKNSAVLIIFTGPHCYISSSWYNNPQTASTWNYMTVQAKGKIIFTDDEGTYKAIKAVTDKYEGTETAGAFNTIPEEYIMPLLKAIVGFTIKVENFEHVFKLSQNKTSNEQMNIIAALKNRGDYNSVMIAEEMKKRLG